MLDSTITSKGQTTIPASLRALLGVKPGDKITYMTKPNGDITIKRKKTYKLEDLFGCLPKPKKTLTIEEMDEGIAKYLGKKYGPKKAGRKSKT